MRARGLGVLAAILITSSLAGAGAQPRAEPDAQGTPGAAVTGTCSAFRLGLLAAHLPALPFLELGWSDDGLWTIDALGERRGRLLLGAISQPDCPRWMLRLTLRVAQCDPFRPYGTRRWLRHYELLTSILARVHADELAQRILLRHAFELPSVWVRDHPLAWWTFWQQVPGDAGPSMVLVRTNGWESAWHVGNPPPGAYWPDPFDDVHMMEGRTDGLVEILTADSENGAVTATFRQRVRLVDHPHDIVKPIRDPEFMAALNQGLSVAIDNRHRRTVVNISIIEGDARDRLTNFAVANPGMTVAVRIEILDGRNLIASAEAQILSRSAWPHIEFRSFDLDHDGLVDTVEGAADIGHFFPVDLSFHSPHGPARLNAAENLTVRLRGDPWLAIRDFSARSYWEGTIEVPVRLDPMR